MGLLIQWAEYPIGPLIITQLSVHDSVEHISLCVRCASYSVDKIHNEAVILLVCKNMSKNLSLLLSNLLGGLVSWWQKANMAIVGYSEGSLCHARCKYRSVIPDSD